MPGPRFVSLPGPRSSLADPAGAGARQRSSRRPAERLKSVGRPGTVPLMRHLLLGALTSAVLLVGLAAPVLAHGDHDARPLARRLAAGPFQVSLWQVYPDAGTSMTPHLIVVFDGAQVPSASVVVGVEVNATVTAVQRSSTTVGGWETSAGVAEGDVVTVTISDAGRTWDLGPIIVPPAPTSMLPMEELIYLSMFLTIGTAWWAASRTARAWRKPMTAAG